jgi:rhodanese-related sulfurtransferase
MDHSAGFLRLVDEARPRVNELTVAEARAKLDGPGGAVLVDVREDSEWNAGRAAGAVHIGKGVLERDLERRVGGFEVELLLYCGGGFRSILAADAARKMGFRRVFSIAGGYREIVAAGWKVDAA